MKRVVRTKFDIYVFMWLRQSLTVDNFFYHFALNRNFISLMTSACDDFTDFFLRRSFPSIFINQNGCRIHNTYSLSPNIKFIHVTEYARKHSQTRHFNLANIFFLSRTMYYIIIYAYDVIVDFCFKKKKRKKEAELCLPGL